MTLLGQVRKSKPIDEDGDMVDVRIAGLRQIDEEDASGANVEENDRLVEEMNMVAGAAGARQQKLPSTQGRKPDQAQQTRQSPRKRKIQGPVATSPNKRRDVGETHESSPTRAAEVQGQLSTTRAPNAKASRLSMRPKRDKSITYHSTSNFEIPTDGQPERLYPANPRPTDVPARNLHSKRGLQQKANTKSPLKGHGVVTTDIAGVNFEETSPSARRRGRPPSGAKRQKKPSPSVENGLVRRKHENDQTTAPPSGQQDPDHDADGSYVDEAHEDDAESASDEDARREAEERTKQRREALDGIEQAASLFERQEAWAELIIAGRALTLKQNSRQPESESGKRAIIYIRQIRSLFITSRADGDTPVDMNIMRQRYKRYCGLYHAQLDAFQPDYSNTSHGRVEQSRDLHQHLIPALIEACKAALQTLFQGTQPAWAEFDLLAELLLTTARSVKKAQDWSPRPTTMDGGILGDMRNKVGKNIKNLLNLFTNKAKALRAQIDEETLLKKLGKLQEENQARFWQDIKDRRARVLRKACAVGNVREPLVDITTQVIAIHDLNVSGTQQSMRTVRNAAMQQIRVWSELETHALLIGLKQYAGLDALRKIHDARYKELDSISIEDMRQRLQILQETLRGVAGAKEDPFLRHVVSFPN